MLSYLSICNHVLVDALDLDFQKGLTVISGETGAGKSILLDALQLALGGRADYDQVREGTDRAEIQAALDLSTLDSARQWLDEQDLSDSDDDSQCILRRVTTSKGSSKAWINGKLVNLTTMRQFGEQVVSIHSQHEHQQLLKPSQQLILVDRFGELTAQRQTVAELFNSLAVAQMKLTELQEQQARASERSQYLNDAITDLDALGLRPGEFADLEIEQKHLASAESSLVTLHEVLNGISSDQGNDLMSATGQIMQKLERLAASTPACEDALNYLSNAQTELDEAHSALRHAIEQTQLNPERLAEVEARLSAAFELARKYRIQPEELPSYLDRLTAERDQIANSSQLIGEIQQQVQQLEQAYQKKAQSLSKARKAAAKTINQQVTPLLHQLNMTGAEMQVRLTERSASTTGIDQVEFYLQANPGSPPRPLAKSASGGELSRVSLALQVILANEDTPTLFFDEVDAGIGGETGSVVGQLLSQLGLRTQVICITHLAQVAAAGHQHFSVEKQVYKHKGNASTRTQIRALQGKDREYEVARMLSGTAESEASQAHARELLGQH